MNLRDETVIVSTVCTTIRRANHSIPIVDARAAYHPFVPEGCVSVYLEVPTYGMHLIHSKHPTSASEENVFGFNTVFNQLRSILGHQFACLEYAPRGYGRPVLIAAFSI